MRLVCAALGGLLLTQSYWISPPAGLALLLFVFWDQLSAAALHLWIIVAGDRLLRDLRRHPHQRASGFLVFLTQERQAGSAGFNC